MKTTVVVLMVIEMWGPAGRWELKKLWELRKEVPLEHCLTMNQIASQGGKEGVMFTRCEEIKK